MKVYVILRRNGWPPPCTAPKLYVTPATCRFALRQARE